MRVGDWIGTDSREGYFLDRGDIVSGKPYQVWKVIKGCSGEEVVVLRDERKEVIHIGKEYIEPNGGRDWRIGEVGWKISSFEENLEKILEEE